MISRRDIIVGVTCIAIVSALSPLASYAAKQILGSQIKNGTVASVDLKNGNVRNIDLGANSVTSAKIADGTVTTTDLSPGAVSGIKATVYNQPTNATVAPTFNTALTPASGTTSQQLTTTLAGDLLILKGMPAISYSDPSNFNVTSALYLDGTPVPNMAVSSFGFDFGMGATANVEFNLEDLIIENVSAGVHTLALRYELTSGAVATSSGAFGQLTVVELG